MPQPPSLSAALFLAVMLLPTAAPAQGGAWPSVASRALWQEVDMLLAHLAGETGFARLSPRVRAALEAVPRPRFIPEDQRTAAYENRPVPIGYGQTISQPLIVAIMSELLAVQPGDKVFELGTGSGYQAAILAELGAQVFSVEIVAELAQRARGTLDELGYSSAQTRLGDGYFGWPEHAPFDAIIVTAANDHIPPPLIQQLKSGGRMVIPVGSRYTTQKLVMVERDAEGQIRTRELMPVTFVPLTGVR